METSLKLLEEIREELSDIEYNIRKLNRLDKYEESKKWNRKQDIRNNIYDIKKLLEELDFICRK